MERQEELFKHIDDHKDEMLANTIASVIAGYVFGFATMIGVLWFSSMEFKLWLISF